MNIERILKRYGLFDVKVPRYTSYPPANRFEPVVGRQMQEKWLRAVRPGEPISLYIHIPFCRRLCWFCACRTQGTKTLRPVADYVATLLIELAHLRNTLPADVKLSRVHLGGGTPTILTSALMTGLLEDIFNGFELEKDFEFSAEIDPTEAAPNLLATLADWGLTRASIGVQDFDLRIQSAIGRPQSVAQTRDVADILRAQGIKSLNIDVLYGLPFQTNETLEQTLKEVINLDPDRLALYGYAHVPWMSKRQVMINSDALPDPQARHRLASKARAQLTSAGYMPVGIDHYALPEDQLAHVASTGGLRRNFQGYTDDQSETLIGLGASAISRFREGYVQNAVPTAAYADRILSTGRAGNKGLELSRLDRLIGRIIEGLMCYGRVDLPALYAEFPSMTCEIDLRIRTLLDRFPDLFSGSSTQFSLPEHFMCMARVVSAAVEGADMAQNVHSIAI